MAKWAVRCCPVIDLLRKGDRMDPIPDYDASDELEYGFQAFAWLLRGVYPPPHIRRSLDSPRHQLTRCSRV